MRSAFSFMIISTPCATAFLSIKLPLCISLIWIIFKPLKDAGKLLKASFTLLIWYLYWFENPYNRLPKSVVPTAMPTQLKKVDLVIPSPLMSSISVLLKNNFPDSHCIPLRKSSTKKNTSPLIFAKNKPMIIANKYVLTFLPKKFCSVYTKSKKPSTAKIVIDQ